MRDFRWPWLWRAIGWAMLAAVIYLCAMPKPPNPLPMEHSDKLYHAGWYAALGAWNAWMYGEQRRWLAGIAGLVLFGIAIELMQAALPWRGADPWDALANAGGVAVGSLLWFGAAGGVLQRIDRRLPALR